MKQPPTHISFKTVVCSKGYTSAVSICEVIDPTLLQESMETKLLRGTSASLLWGRAPGTDPKGQRMRVPHF